ncbi:hypothetical protein KS4_11560 [Poriferisphaera corsica]|uniref:Integral membrane protein n=1 Tax=Poriferisphaera corsica TaxID=2528020 RepID=A0A517YSB9_9BACT|nr:hypothetical protein [Poriferisphaera corsica]QDU33114.1 hypothetical protein KS4_11560 [Poriferisphaera corsica]
MPTAYRIPRYLRLIILIYLSKLLGSAMIISGIVTLFAPPYAGVYSGERTPTITNTETLIIMFSITMLVGGLITYGLSYAFRAICDTAINSWYTRTNVEQSQFNRETSEA